MVARWTFFDPYSSDTVTLSINPNAGGSPSLSKNITTAPTIVPGGRVIRYEGEKDPEMITFGGTIRDNAMIVLYAHWFNKRHQIQLTDDLGRTQMIMIQKFVPRRVRMGGNAWKHTFEVTAIVVDGP